MLRKIFSHIGVGLAVGYPVTTACMWIFGAWQATGLSVMRMYTVWLAASVVYSLISLIYDTELPLALSIGIHLAGCIATTFVASWAAGLFKVFEPWPFWFVYVLPAFFVMYLIIGGVIYLDGKHKARKINKKIG